MTASQKPGSIRAGSGRPFAKGADPRRMKGKPKGSRNRATLALQALLEGEGEKLTRKAVELALAGDGTALRLCLERLIPPSREARVSVPLPEIATAADLPGAVGAILQAVAGGELTPSEGEKLAALLAAWAKAEELATLETRIQALEQRQNRSRR